MGLKFTNCRILKLFFHERIILIEHASNFDYYLRHKFMISFAELQHLNEKSYYF